ncbi:MAG: primosomal protein N' [Geobacter sp.]|nr:primosomal protein N' [Geobacter sp.]
MSAPSSSIIEVAVPLQLSATFHYAVPEKLRPCVQVGKRVLVPFGRRKLTGYVLGFPSSTEQELKEVLEVLDEEPLFTPEELTFYRWVGEYYHAPLGSVIRTALPAGLTIQSRKRVTVVDDGSEVSEEVLSSGQKARTETFYRPAACLEEGVAPRGKGRDILEFLVGTGEVSSRDLRQRFGECGQQLRRLRELGLVEAVEREVYRDPFREEVAERDVPRVPNEWQTAALREIFAATDAGRFAPFLLHGVTGSGKTEVYLQAIAHALELGRNALVLVPEIALTPQLVRRFRSRFDCGIAVLHSGLSDGERFDEWRRIRRGEVRIVIGARSAIFAPLRDVGILVVDEEHEGSYKQSEGVRYNARDLALVRGKNAHAVVLLGSATPLVTTFNASREKKLGYLPLPERARGAPLPEVSVIDTRGQAGQVLAPSLETALAENLAQGGQSIVFLNRRGFATFLICEGCGHVLRCPNCAVTLTYHQRARQNRCHYCDYAIPAPSVCPACDGGELKLLGLGTERVEEALREVFPEARIARMDRDTTTGKGGHARILKGIEEGKTDILVGTQMIAKGHDFPGVTLVGVMAADALLNLPDFRSAERAFQLLTQVAGRAGRGDAPGRVMVQALEPEHYALACALRHDYEGFYEQEVEFRHDAGYPPFAHLAVLIFSGNVRDKVDVAAGDAGQFLRRHAGKGKGRVEVLGPVAAPLALLRGKHRRQILLKSASRSELHRLVSCLERNFSQASGVRVQVDIDPVDML